ncbi:GGDEF domain-containing protein [Gorillibacterium massiliense]|uniref:substrate-binding and GGDEF domain-containing protein n=1 Tax=Gorillibacterium massiliense TaxID=1280390 RepID=UPI00138E175B|nr:GGDEF domain-containing protein [Gorillibacterium massiliense]
MRETSILKRITIGLMAENNWLKNENVRFLFQGVADACETNDANLIRFGYMNANELLNVESQHLVITDLIREFHLDGLIFLGWTLPVQGENLERLRQMVDVPMFSIGKKLEDIPSNFMHGGYYLRKLILHLIREHAYTRIAYICPWSYDGRNDIYKRTLDKAGLLDLDLYISESELTGLNMYERAQRAVSILLDERKVAPDVIIAMTMEEAYTVQILLKSRGYRVPEDIAICSYEDGQRMHYATPSITSIVYPTRALAFQGTTRLIEYIETGSTRLISGVAGKIEYRESCGCQLVRNLEEFEQELVMLAKQNEEKDYYHLLIEEIDQMIMTSYDKANLYRVLTVGMNKLNISNSMVFHYPSGNRSFKDCILEFEISEGVEKISHKPATFEGRKREGLFPVDRRFTYLAELLHVGDNHFGFMLMESSNLDVLNYLSLASHLSTAIKSINLIAKLESEIEIKKQNEIRLFQLAQFDQLTDLYNRTSFHEILARLSREHKRFTLLYMDIDGFKAVNDEFGHSVGDILLTEIAGRIRFLLDDIAFIPEGFSNVVSARQAIFRLGGDEFTAIINIIDKDVLGELTDQVIRALREPFLIQEYEIRIGASLGMSQFPDDTDDLQTLIKYADRSMYESKRLKR